MALHCTAGTDATTCLAICAYVAASCPGVRRIDDTRTDDAISQNELSVHSFPMLPRVVITLVLLLFGLSRCWPALAFSSLVLFMPSLAKGLLF